MGGGAPTIWVVSQSQFRIWPYNPYFLSDIDVIFHFVYLPVLDTKQNMTPFQQNLVRAMARLCRRGNLIHHKNMGLSRAPVCYPRERSVFREMEGVFMPVPTAHHR